jgi:hypothetical protein
MSITKKRDPTNDPEFQKVVRHFLTTPHQPHKPVGKKRPKIPKIPATTTTFDGPCLPPV